MQTLIQILKTIWNKLFGRKQSVHSLSTDSSPYELVETKMDDNHFRQGIRILGGKYDRVIVTTSPKIQFKHEDDRVTMLFDFTVEYHPDSTEIDHQELRKIVGDIILDIIYKDNNAPRTTDSEHSG